MDQTWKCSNCRNVNANTSENCERCNTPRLRLKHLPPEIKSKLLSTLRVHDLYHLQRDLCKFSLILCRNQWRECIDLFFPKKISEMHLIYSASAGADQENHIVFAAKGESMAWNNSIELMQIMDYMDDKMDIKTHQQVFQANTNIVSDYRANYAHLQPADNSVVFVEFNHPFGMDNGQTAFNFIADFALSKVQTEHRYLTITVRPSEVRPQIKHFFLTNATCNEEEHHDWNDLQNPGDFSFPEALPDPTDI